MARDEWRTTYVHTPNNEADLLTNIFFSGDKRKGFVRRVLNHAYGCRYFFLFVVDIYLHAVVC